MGLSKNNIKLITSLQQKKYRKQHNLFVAEGVKVVNELVNSSLKIHTLYHTNNFVPYTNANTFEVTETELKKISNLKSPNSVLGIFQIPEITEPEPDQFTLVLDGINDPGNLGTIIRLCDWFGITQIVCSNNTVDCYNPKVVQASMGSILRVKIHYTDVLEFINKTNLPVFKTAMKGINVYKTCLPQKAILIMGNEANGVSPDVEKAIEKAITIPRFGTIQQTESLNVAVATGILLSEFKR